MLRTSRRSRTLAAVALTLALATSLAGCAVSSVPAPTEAPAPGATVAAVVPTPAPSLGEGFSVVVLTSRDDDADEVATVRAALEVSLGDVRDVTWLDSAGVDDRIALADDAFARAPDLIVVVGPSLLGAVDGPSAGALSQPVLLLGGQLAEPTDNVTAVVWPGADGRASLRDETLPFSGAAAHAGPAVAVGLQAFLDDELGLVYRLGD